MPKQTSKQDIKKMREAVRHRSFSLDTRAVDMDARTVEVAFSSEQPVDRGTYVEVLDHAPGSINLDRLRDGGPVLIDHSNSIRDQVGVIESVITGSDSVNRGRFRFGKSALSEEILQGIGDGIITKVSVGYMVDDVIGQTRDEAVGKDIYRFSWTPFEVSFVAIPADNSVGVGRSFNDDEEVTTMPGNTQENTNATLQTVADQAEIARQAGVEAKRLFEKEKKRMADIMSLGGEHPAIGGVALAIEAVREGTTVQDFQRIILDKIKTSTARPEAFTPSGEGVRVNDRADADLRNGFVDFGQFARNVVFASVGRSLDAELETRAAASFSNTESGPDGGYAVPQEFGQQIVELALAEQGLLALSESTPLQGNSMTFPKDEGTPWGTTGVTATWEGEGVQKSPDKSNELEEFNLKLRKLKVLVSAGDELIADASAMGAYLMRKMSTRLEWKVQDAIVNGSGAGQPLGITNSAAVVTQAKEATQTADTIVQGNMSKMFGRVIMGAGANLVWLINPDAYNQVITLNSGGDLIWTPDFRATPGGLLLGRPVIMTDTCQTLGDKNDVILANMAGYHTATKAGGTQMSQSMHLWFDQDLQAFKLIFRMDGKPLLRAPVTPPNSAVTRSHFVNLAART